MYHCSISWEIKLKHIIHYQAKRSTWHQIFNIKFSSGPSGLYCSQPLYDIYAFYYHSHRNNYIWSIVLLSSRRSRLCTARVVSNIIFAKLDIGGLARIERVDCKMKIQHRIAGATWYLVIGGSAIIYWKYCSEHEDEALRIVNGAA